MGKKQESTIFSFHDGDLFVYTPIKERKFFSLYLTIVVL